MTQEKKMTLVRKIVPVVYTLSIALGCAYIAYRIQCWGNMLTNFQTGYVIWPIMTIYFAMSLRVSRTYLVARSQKATYAAGFSSFVVMVLAIMIPVFDLIQLALRPLIHEQSVRDLIFIISGFVCLITVSISAAAGIHHANRLRTVHYDVKCPGLHTKNYRMVLLADLHIGYYIGADYIRNVVERVNSLHPDIVVIAGDIINAGRTRECPEIDKVAEILSQLSSKEGTYAVVGNHDPFVYDYDFQDFIRKSNIHLLEDSVYTNEYFHLIGRTTCQKKRLDISELRQGLSADRPVFIMDHDPIGVREAVAEDTALVMCGHTHKGQILPMRLFVHMLYRPEEIWGCSRVKNTNVVVTAGTGYFSMPMRIGSDSEVVCLNISGEEV